MDIRKPIGQLFLILGTILMAWGIFGGEAAAGKLPFNLNLWWGCRRLPLRGCDDLLRPPRSGCRVGSRVLRDWLRLLEVAVKSLSALSKDQGAGSTELI
jgi:hypothetical protein